MRYLLILACLLICRPGSAGDKVYPVSGIPQSLLKDADVVVRLDESKVTVNNPTSVTWRIHRVITILNENGDRFATMSAGYDKLKKISNIRGAIYDADGVPMKKIKEKDVQDVSDVSDANWDDDSRAKVYRFSNNKYPFTVEYAYDVAITHTFNLPSWTPQTNEQIAVQSSSFEIECPEDFAIRYKQYNVAEPTLGNVPGKKLFKWELNDKPATKIPKYFSSWRDFQPVVFVAPNEFQLGQFSGNMENWKNFGLFMNQLVKNKGTLPETVKMKVHELIANAKDDKEKVFLLYRYLQQNTRYVSVQLGIGGWEPFDASYVANKGYGDCKALVNYMQSLLKEAGIAAYYTLVYAGDSHFAKKYLIESFPSNQFNHVILCVPLSGDTTWLECTSQTIPAGYMGGFTANRKALVLRDDGGYIVSTPRYEVRENQLIRNTTIDLQKDGNAQIVANTVYSGLQQDDLYGMIKGISPEKIKRYLSKAISLPSYEIKDFKYHSSTSELPSLTEDLNISTEGFATVTGKRVFIAPNVFSRSGLNMDYDTSRKAGFVFNDSYHDSDYTEIILPAGYKIEAAIRPISIKTSFAKYVLSCTLEGDKIIYSRTMEQYDAKLPVEDQKEVVDFYKQVYKADRAKLVLVTDNG